jgi:cholesterol transport system auxiliary component
VPIIVAEMESNPALDSTAILYRLAYDNAQQLHPYAQARWSVLPAQLLRQRLRDQLGQRHTLISPADTRLPSPANPAPTPATSPPLTLRLELEEFSQLFESPDKSVGLLRLRVTATQSRVGGEKWLAQRHIIVQRPAPSANAPGGVQALTQATDAAVLEIDAWLQDVAR